MKMMKTLKARAEVLVMRYGIQIGTVFDSDDAGYVEYVIHELSHAKLLKLDLEKEGDLSGNVGRRLQQARRKDIQVAAERRVWSVEWVTLQSLPGMIDRFTWADMVEGASIQEVNKVGLRLMNLQTKTWWARKYAREIVEMLSA